MLSEKECVQLSQIIVRAQSDLFIRRQFMIDVMLMRMVHDSVMTQANSEEEMPSAPIRSRT